MASEGRWTQHIRLCMFVHHRSLNLCKKWLFPCCIFRQLILKFLHLVKQQQSMLCIWRRNSGAPCILNWQSCTLLRKISVTALNYCGRMTAIGMSKLLPGICQCHHVEQLKLAYYTKAVSFTSLTAQSYLQFQIEILCVATKLLPTIHLACRRALAHWHFYHTLKHWQKLGFPLSIYWVHTVGFRQFSIELNLKNFVGMACYQMHCCHFNVLLLMFLNALTSAGMQFLLLLAALKSACAQMFS